MDDIKHFLKKLLQEIIEDKDFPLTRSIVLGAFIIVCIVIIIIGNVISLLCRNGKNLWHVLKPILLKINSSISAGTFLKWGVFTIAFSFFLFNIIHFLHEKAQALNQYYIGFKYNNQNSSISLYNKPDIDEYLSDVPTDFYTENFINVFNAIYSNNTSLRVSNITNYLNIPALYNNKLNFSSVADYLFFLRSIGLQDFVSQAEDYLINTEDMSVDTILKLYKHYALGEFEMERYDFSEKYCKSFYRVYNQLHEFPLNGKNNDIHIINLMLEFHWEILINAKFVGHVLSCVTYDNYLNLSNFSEINKGNCNQLMLCKYFDGIQAFELGEFTNALNEFRSIIDMSPEPSLLTQYCMHMAIRSAWWNYNKYSTKNSYNIFWNVCNEYDTLIKLPYFSQDIYSYKESVFLNSIE